MLLNHVLTILLTYWHLFYVMWFVPPFVFLCVFHFNLHKQKQLRKKKRKQKYWLLQCFGQAMIVCQSICLSLTFQTLTNWICNSKPFHVRVCIHTYSMCHIYYIWHSKYDTTVAKNDTKNKTKNKTGISSICFVSICFSHNSVKYGKSFHVAIV